MSLTYTAICEPKYKYGQQEQATVRNHNISTALERSVLKAEDPKPAFLDQKYS